MSAIDFLKDAFRIAQKIDNVEDQNKIIDLSSLAMQQQEEIMNLKNEIREMKKDIELTNSIKRHEALYLTRKNEQSEIKYCAHCWDSEHKLIQVSCTDSGEFNCPHCKTHGIFDKEMYEKAPSPFRVIPRENKYR